MPQAGPTTSSRERFARGGISVGNLGWRQWMAFQDFGEARPADDALAISQGGVISPCLSNVFLHYVLDEWFETEVRPRLKGEKACADCIEKLFRPIVET